MKIPANPNPNQGKICNQPGAFYWTNIIQQITPAIINRTTKEEMEVLLPSLRPLTPVFDQQYDSGPSTIWN